MRDPIWLNNEFARVCVQLDQSANGVRLMIKDVRTGRTIFLDPLELEALAWCEHGDLARLLNPSESHWKTPEQEENE